MSSRIRRSNRVGRAVRKCFSLVVDIFVVALVDDEDGERRDWERACAINAYDSVQYAHGVGVGVGVILVAA